MQKERKRSIGVQLQTIDRKIEKAEASLETLRAERKKLVELQRQEFGLELASVAQASGMTLEEAVKKLKA